MRSAIRTGTGLVIKLPFRLGERLRTFDRAGDAMTTFAELVEAPVDWYAELPSSYRDKLRGDPGYMRDLIYQERRRRVLTGAAPASVGPSTPELPWWVRPFSPRRVSREVETTFMDHCFDELHELLCSDSEKYAADRKSILSEYRAGHATLVAGLTASMAPYLGSMTVLLPAVAAIALTTIGHVGLRGWCAMQTERKRARKKGEVPDG
jgi:hypothetical protein